MRQTSEISNKASHPHGPHFKLPRVNLSVQLLSCSVLPSGKELFPLSTPTTHPVTAIRMALRFWRAPLYPTLTLH